LVSPSERRPFAPTGGKSYRVVCERFGEDDREIAGRAIGVKARLVS
jgi:hypothetical protein